MILLIGQRPKERGHGEGRVYKEKGRPGLSTQNTKPASIDVNANSDGTSPPRFYTNTLDEIRHIINYGLNIRQPAYPQTDACRMIQKVGPDTFNELFILVILYNIAGPIIFNHWIVNY